MFEIDDYNSEYFFELEDTWDNYDTILDELENNISEQDKKFAYDIFSLEEALSLLRQLGDECAILKFSADTATAALEKFINDYTKCYEGD